MGVRFLWSRQLHGKAITFHCCCLWQKSALRLTNPTSKFNILLISPTYPGLRAVAEVIWEYHGTVNNVTISVDSKRGARDWGVLLNRLFQFGKFSCEQIKNDPQSIDTGEDLTIVTIICCKDCYCLKPNTSKSLKIKMLNTTKKRRRRRRKSQIKKTNHWVVFIAKCYSCAWTDLGLFYTGMCTVIFSPQTHIQAHKCILTNNIPIFFPPLLFRLMLIPTDGSLPVNN